jgi:hypothetical protein
MDRINKAENEFLERSRIALTNAQSDTRIKPILGEYGMDDEKIAEGWEIYNTTKTTWEQNKKETAETKIASNAYRKEYDELQALFKEHRDKTIIFFKKQPDILIRLGVEGKFPTKYRDFFDKTKHYYQTILENEEVQQKTSLIKITSGVATGALAKHESLLSKRAEYEKEYGESQEATKSKNEALLELKDWMEDFDNMAKVALYNHPQLLEVLGIFVRS